MFLVYVIKNICNFALGKNETENLFNSYYIQEK